MTPTHEPYVAEPTERRSRPRLAGSQPWLVTVIVLLLAAQVTFLVLRGLAEQDPSLQVPIGEPTPGAEEPP